jgi:hypothetical protein
MTRDLLRVATWRWVAGAAGLASLAGALIAARSNDPYLGTCLHPAANWTAGHCPLCWASAAAFCVAAAPSGVTWLRVAALRR